MTKPSSTQIDSIISFIREVMERAGRQRVVIGVSGGIDSALALTLLTKALPSSALVSVLLPYGDQDMSDARLLLEHLEIKQDQVEVVDIKPIVTSAIEALKINSVGADAASQLRQGNLRARARMMVLFDLAHRLEGLVCGTENKSEKYLGYFTRFGDAASDFEPMSHLYKTQVRQLAELLGVPEIIRQKEPSAGLWAGQTDEVELGFDYQVADLVLEQAIDVGLSDPGEIATKTSLELSQVEAVLERVRGNQFKHQVPYVL